MKNAALKKQVEVAACPRTAMKMAAEDAAMKKMHSPAKAMKTPMKKMDAPTKAMKESATKFNAELKKASAEGKLKGKFKEAVDNSPVKAMKETPVKAMKSPSKKDGSSKIDQQIKQAEAKLDAFYKIDFNEERDNPKSKYRYYRADDINSLEGSLRDKIKKLKNQKKSQGVGPGYTSAKATSPNKAMKESATKKMKSPTKAMKSPTKAMKSPMKKDGTRFVDKVKAAGRALKDNLFKVHDHGNVHNTLTANTNRSYKKYKKQYREAGKGKK